MARPVKLRKIEQIPDVKYFKPSGIKKHDLEEIVLKVEELEAMRLKDIEKLKQEECAEIMKVSRQTFQLIIDSARFKVASALIEGKAIKIEGGNYTLNICKYKCQECGASFEQGYEADCIQCPNCGSVDFSCTHGDHFCQEKCEKEGCK